MKFSKLPFGTSTVTRDCVGTIRAATLRAAPFTSVPSPSAVLGSSLGKKLITDYAESFEAAAAMGALIDFYAEGKRWDDCVAIAKNSPQRSSASRLAAERAGALLCTAG